MLFAPPPPVQPPRDGAVALFFDTSVLGVAERPDGTVTVATTEGKGGEFSGSGGGRDATLRLHHLGDAGEIGAPVDVPSQVPFELLSLLPTGSMLRFRTTVRNRNHPASVTIRDADASGNVTATQQIVSPGKYASVWGAHAGPTGTIAMLTSDTTKRRRVVSVLTRGAGASTFRKPVKLDALGRDFHPVVDPDGDGIDQQYDVAMAPAGGGAIVSAPDSRHARGTALRWIAADGTVGPRIDLGLKWRGLIETEIAFGPTGKLTILAHGIGDTKRWRPPEQRPSKVFSVTIPFGTRARPRWYTVENPRKDGAYFGRQMAVAPGPGEHVAAMVSSGSDLAVLDGDGGRLTESTNLTAHGPEELQLFAGPDGALGAIWQNSADDEFEDEGAYAAFRPAGNSYFGREHRVTPSGHFTSPGLRVPTLEEAYPLSGGRIAMVYREYEGNSGPLFVSIVQRCETLTC